MASERPILYLDACAIIEAHRAGCWAALAGRFDCHTVHEVWDELGRGNPADRDYVKVEREAMTSQVTVHEVGRKEVATAQLRCPGLAAVDAGERELLAHCLASGAAGLMLTTGDKAAILAACALGLDRALVSLEELAAKIGQRVNLLPHYQKTWLSKIRTGHLMDHL